MVALGVSEAQERVELEMSPDFELLEAALPGDDIADSGVVLGTRVGALGVGGPDHAGGLFFGDAVLGLRANAANHLALHTRLQTGLVSGDLNPDLQGQHALRGSTGLGVGGFGVVAEVEGEAEHANRFLLEMAPVHRGMAPFVSVSGSVAASLMFGDPDFKVLLPRIELRRARTTYEDPFGTIEQVDTDGFAVSIASRSYKGRLINIEDAAFVRVESDTTTFKTPCKGLEGVVPNCPLDPFGRLGETINKLKIRVVNFSMYGGKKGMHGYEKDDGIHIATYLGATRLDNGKGESEFDDEKRRTFVMSFLISGSYHQPSWAFGFTTERQGSHTPDGRRFVAQWRTEVFGAWRWTHSGAMVRGLLVDEHLVEVLSNRVFHDGAFRHSSARGELLMPLAEPWELGFFAQATYRAGGALDAGDPFECCRTWHPEGGAFVRMNLAGWADPPGKVLR